MSADSHQERSPGGEERGPLQEVISPEAEGVNSAETQAKTTQNDVGIAPFPRPRPNVVLASPSPSNVTARPAADASSIGTGPSPEILAHRPLLGREDNTIAEYYRNRGPPGPPPVDTPENCRKGALVHAGLTLLRLDSADMHDECSTFRQLCVALWSEDEVEQMRAYLIGTRDQSPGPTERNIFYSAFVNTAREERLPARDGGLVHAALTVVRLQHGDKEQAARDMRQLSSVLWDDPSFQTMLNYVSNNHGAATRTEERRFDEAELGMQAPEQESDSQ